MTHFVKKIMMKSKKFDKEVKKMFKNSKKKGTSKFKFMLDITYFGWNWKDHYKMKCSELHKQDEKTKIKMH